MRIPALYGVPAALGHGGRGIHSDVRLGSNAAF